VIKDLVVDRARSTGSSRRRDTSVCLPGSAPDGNTILVPKENADRAMDAAACIGCGACVAACPNASAALFTGAKIAHLGLLPQGQPERHQRALSMVRQYNAEGLWEAAPISASARRRVRKEISLEVIARMNRDFIGASSPARAGNEDDSPSILQSGSTVPFYRSLRPRGAGLRAQWRRTARPRRPA
jgi:succinate dehydrogenase / fumarate reductase iron-sulfur subunit